MRNFIAICLLIFASFSANAAQETYPDIEKYVSKVVKQVSDVLNNSSSEDKKVEESKKLLSSNLQLEWMASYTLGRHRKTCSEPQKSTFKKTYSQYIVKSFSDLVKNYKGEEPKVKGVKKIDENEFIVSTKIIKKDGQPSIKVDYLVHKMPDGNFKIADVVTEGVSLINSQREEFNNILKDHDFDSLIGELNKRMN